MSDPTFIRSTAELPQGEYMDNCVECKEVTNEDEIICDTCLKRVTRQLDTHCTKHDIEFRQCEDGDCAEEFAVMINKEKETI